ncbi:MAG: heavy metal-associated domain-containing protein [Gemmatimonadales bacterium]
MAMRNVKLEIEGMKCEGCATAVREALTGVAGVREANVDLAAGSAGIMADERIEDAALVRAVEGAGYTVGAVVAG